MRIVSPLACGTLHRVPPRPARAARHLGVTQSPDQASSARHEGSDARDGVLWVCLMAAAPPVARRYQPRGGRAMCEPRPVRRTIPTGPSRAAGMRYPAVRYAVLPAPAAPHGAAPVARLCFARLQVRVRRRMTRRVRARLNEITRRHEDVASAAGVVSSRHLVVRPAVARRRASSCLRVKSFSGERRLRLV